MWWEQQFSVQMCVCGCNGTLDISADFLQSRKRAIAAQDNSSALHKETFFTAILLRSSNHTQLCTGKHTLAD